MSIIRRVEALRRIFWTEAKKNQEYLVRHARSRGVKKYRYTKHEYKRLRRTAQRVRLGQKLIGNLDKNYDFIQRFTRKARAGAINSITGMCFDVAICEYAQIAKTIEDEKAD